MRSRINPPMLRRLPLMTALCLSLPAVAHAEIHAWYQLINSVGPIGDGVATVSQGASGAPLIITTDNATGAYDFTIRFFASIPQAEAIKRYSVDMIAPNDATVSATALSFLGPFDRDSAITLGSGPGVIVDDAGQFNLLGSPGQSGTLMLFDFVVHLTGPPTADLELFSGIGASNWEPFGLVPLSIVFADSLPIPGSQAGAVSSTPSIVFRPDPTGGGLDCNGNGIPDDQEIAIDPSIDCNLNAIPDECDIADQTSNDCQPDGIPDECQLDSGAGGLFAEDFDDIGTLQAAGWVPRNNSQPIGATGWDQGNDSVFPAHLGAPTAYISANFQNAGEPPPATISNWLITPQLLLVDGRTLTFFTRTDAGSAFPDRLEVRMSLAGFSSDVGTTATSVGDFTTLLLRINPTLVVGGYPEAWAQFQIVLSGIGTPTEGRLAFRYFVEDSGPQGANGNYIGIDTIRLTGVMDNDTNGNGIPDECEADCNSNGIADVQDIADGTSLDCNGNLIPDECDLADGTSLDCNTNGIPDDCDIADGTSLDDNANGIPDECEAPDCNANGTPDDQDISGGTSLDCNTNGIPDECDLVDGTSLDCNTNNIPDECDIADGTSLDDNANGIPDECEAPDCNANGTPDDQDIAGGTSQDCNTNSIPDECDLTDGTSLDCNANTIPDECDIADATSPDCNANGIPDECETDCDGNGIPDDCDIAADPSLDLNNNGIPDACEAVDCNDNGIPDLQEILDGTTPDCDGNLVPDDCDIDPGDPDGNGQTSPDCNANGVPDECDLTDGTSPDCNTNGIPDACDIADGSSQDCNTNDIPDDCETDCDGNGVPDDCDILADPTIDMDGNGVPDVCEFVDCNGNGTPDDQDISGGTSPDCNANGVPDECDIDLSDPDGNGENSRDCNANGIPDECDIADGTSGDCNANSIPDDCETDCDGNGIPDECDILADPTIDMDGNGIPDSCEGADCNGNGTPDDQDISGGTSLDCNANGVPDECDIDLSDPDGNGENSRDCNGNTVPDECETDCDGNGIPDDCDILADPTLDMDGNGIPDSCEMAGIVDCNANGIADDQEIADDPGIDCNTNGIPDGCDVDPADPDGNGMISTDCQGDSIPDECQIGQTTDVLFTEDFDDVSILTDQDWMLINNSNPIGPSTWDQGVAETFSAHMGEATAYIAANFDSTGTPPPATISNWLILPERALEDGQTFSFFTRTIADSQFADRLEIRMSLAGPSLNVGADETSVGDFTTLLRVINPDLETGGYPAEWALFEVVLSGIGGPTNGRIAFRYFVEDGGPEGTHSNFIGIDTVRLTRVVNLDANGNGIPDTCEVVDCNGNGIPDDQDIADGTSGDCNNNGVPDSCDIADGTSVDCNGNKIPDDCETDCDQNGIPDDCDIATDPALDADDNGVPDACEIVDCDGNGIADPLDIEKGTRLDCNANGVPDRCDIDDGTEADTDGNGIPDSCETAAPPPTEPPAGEESPNLVRSFLAFFLDVPADGNEPMSAVPARALGFLGVPMTIALMFLEWLNLPIRLLLFELIAGLFGGA